MATQEILDWAHPLPLLLWSVLAISLLLRTPRRVLEAMQVAVLGFVYSQNVSVHNTVLYYYLAYKGARLRSGVKMGIFFCVFPLQILFCAWLALGIPKSGGGCTPL